MLRNLGTLTLVLAAIQVFTAGCDNTPWTQDSAAGAALPGLTRAKATSNHYVEVTFASPASDAGEVASNYTIVDPDGNPLPVHTAELSADGRQAILTTDQQKQILYTLTVPTKPDPLVLMDLVPAMGIGSLGFVGSSDREPFLQSAISLKNSEILLSFSERMDKESAEDVRYYRIADPDGEADFDIKITKAVLDEDETSVVLETTAQENVEYTISVTNVKSRFTCSDGELVVLDNSDLGQGDVCTARLDRPLTTEDLIAPFSMTARTGIPPSTPPDPHASGNPGTVVTSPCGAGVMLSTCAGSESISGSGVTIPDEELIFTFDRPFRADRIILTLQEIEFATDEPVFFVSTVEKGDFYTILEPEIQAAFAGHGISRGNVLFEALESLDPTEEAPYREGVDVLKLRETNKAYYAESICLTDGRRIDPTRRTVQFFGIPSEDEDCPNLLSAVSTSDLTVLLSFSEPLDHDAADPVNFEITCSGCDTPELLVLDAAMTRHNTQIVLTTHPQTAGAEYTVTVSNANGQVTDLSVNSNEICSDGKEASFTFGGQPSIEPGFALPRVVGAISTSNTTVVVAFSKPMSDSALAASSYSIVQVNVNPEVGTLYVLDNACDEASANAGHVCKSDQDCHGICLDNACDEASTNAGHGCASDQDCHGGVCLENACNDMSSNAGHACVTNLDCNGYCVENACDEASANAGHACTSDTDCDGGACLDNACDEASTNAGHVCVTNLDCRGVCLANACHEASGNAGYECTTDLDCYGVCLDNACDEASTNAGHVCASDQDCQRGNCLLRLGFLGPDRTAVQLTTTSQNEVTYEVTVTNVHDLAGNQLAPKEIMVDPSKAQFAGTPPSGLELVDSDGDGLSDNEELRGWVVMIQQVGGEVLLVEVTSNPSLADTDGDGLDDRAERTRFSNPRSGDTDLDTVPDFDEVFVWHTSLTNQDSDGDGMRDGRELTYFKTSPLYADTDGDGLEDNEEVVLQNRDPRISDLPDPGIEVGEMALRLDTRFAYTDTVGESRSVSKTTSSTLSQSESRTYSTSDASTTQHAVNVSTEIGGGFEAGTTGTKWSGSFKVGVGYGYTRSNTFTASQSSAQETQQQFQESLTTDVTRDITQAVTRTIEGASVEVLVTVNNGGDIPFTVRNVQLTGLLQDPYNRRSFLPVATLLPASALEGGGEFEVTLGPFIPLRGPFIFKSSEVFPSLVEDLMKNPRGLIFEVANFDIEDEEGRNFAFITQDVNDRTVGLIVDYGNGQVDRFRVSTHSSFDFNKCEGATEDDLPVEVFCMSDEDCPPGESCLLADPHPIGTTMGFVLQDILGLANTKSAPPDAILVGPGGCADTFADPSSDDIQVVQPICLPVVAEGDIVTAGANGVLDTLPVGDDEKDPTGTKIIDGGNCCAETRASRDDVQVVPADCQRAFPDGIVIVAGPNGHIDTPVYDNACSGSSGQFCKKDADCPGGESCILSTSGDDELAKVSGYETRPVGACDSNTPRLIDCDDDGCQSAATGDDQLVGQQILPGDNGRIETLPQGNDVLKGPGFPCGVDDDCPGAAPGSCRTTEKLVRFKAVKERASERRFWIILSPVEIPPEIGFDDISLHAGDVYSLAFVQDKDADGLIAREEFLYGSSDLDDNTDGCPFGDGDKRCDRTLYEFDSIRDFEEVREGWSVEVEGRSSYFGFPHPVRPDTDADRLFDDDEQAAGTDPASPDTDNDGISDFDEVRGYQIKRRDGALIRNVVPYQSAKITAGPNGILETKLVGDDAYNDPQCATTTPPPECWITPGNEGNTDPDYVVKLDSIPGGDDVLEGTELILDGGNGVVQTEAHVNDEQVGPSPIGIMPELIVTFLEFRPGSDACDGLQSGEYDFEFSVGNVAGGQDSFTEHNVSIEPFSTHLFGANNTIRVNVPLFPGLMESWISGTISEKDALCDAGTRQAVAVIEPGEVIVDGGDGTADTAVPTDAATGLPLYDDIQEVPAGTADLQPGQVIISPGPNGILETEPNNVDPLFGDGDDVRPTGNGYADTLATGDDTQVTALADPADPGQIIVDCGPDGYPDPQMSPASPGICEEPSGGSSPPPQVCEPVITNGANGVAESSADPLSDDHQLVDPGDQTSPDDVIIGPGENGVIDSKVADFVIRDGGNGTLDSELRDDDVLIEPIVAGEIIIAPGPDGELDSIPNPQGEGNDDSIEPADDEKIEAVVEPPDCSVCPLGDCIYDCNRCTFGYCTGDDVLLKRRTGTSCEDGLCPSGDCLPEGHVDRWSISEDYYSLEDYVPLLESPEGKEITRTFDGSGSSCFRQSSIVYSVKLQIASTVKRGAVLVRPDVDGVLDTPPGPDSDDVKGAPHLAVFATDPLNRDTDGDGLFDGVERDLGANPNDVLDASKYRDNDLDGLANIEEDEGWFVGYVGEGKDDAGNHTQGLHCRKEDGKFALVLDEFDPPDACEIVTSDRFEPDTDFDGLPDLLERLIRSDPTEADTDGDMILDLDELDPGSRFSVEPGVFREFERRCLDAERCAFVPVEEPLGTSLVLADTDRDGRTDWEEEYACWMVFACVNLGESGLPEEVCSDVLRADPDGDGLLDGEEEALGLNPNDADTDGDAIADSVDDVPTGCGKIITLKFDTFTMAQGQDCDAWSDEGEFIFDINVLLPNRTARSFPWERDNVKGGQPVRFPTEFQVRFQLLEGQAFFLWGHVHEHGDGEQWWYWQRGSYGYHDVPASPWDIMPGGHVNDSWDQCFGGAMLQVIVTVEGA